MGKKLTAMIAKYGLLGGMKLYQVRARNTLPYLVRLAKAGQTIYYSDLASQLSYPNPRSFNYILGAIGNALQELSEDTGIDIPPIQCIVINKNRGLPGDGIGWFISVSDFHHLSKSQQKNIVDRELSRIYTFQHWDWVLERLSLEPLTINVYQELEKARSIRGGGESESHKRFKEWVSRNPKKLGLDPIIENIILEYKLYSGDSIDVLFSNDKLMVGVEVKSKISKDDDILRGIFQCVKYKKLLEVEQIVNNEVPNSEVILALEGVFPEKFTLIKNLLDIKVIDQLI